MTAFCRYVGMPAPNSCSCSVTTIPPAFTVNFPRGMGVRGRFASSRLSSSEDGSAVYEGVEDMEGEYDGGGVGNFGGESVSSMQS